MSSEIEATLTSNRVRLRLASICASLSSTSCFPLAGYYRHTLRDPCVDDVDCTAGRCCTYDLTAQHWQCAESQFRGCPL
jgi:hypothetical protein